MWKLIKSDLLYYKYPIMFAYALTWVFFILFVIIEETILYNWVYFMLGIMLYMFITAKWGHYIFFKENLERLYSQLPLSFSMLGIARLLSGIIIWLLLVLSFLLICIAAQIKFPQDLSVWDIISINGIVIMFNAMPLLWNDFIFYSRLKFRRTVAFLFYIPMIFSLMAINYFLTFIVIPGWEGIQESMRYFFFTPDTALFLNLGGVILSYLSYILYLNRDSYLDSAFGLKLKFKS